jgi:hypothetical protein
MPNAVCVHTAYWKRRFVKGFWKNDNLNFPSVPFFHFEKAVLQVFSWRKSGKSPIIPDQRSGGSAERRSNPVNQRPSADSRHADS